MISVSRICRTAFWVVCLLPVSCAWDGVRPSEEAFSQPSEVSAIADPAERLLIEKAIPSRAVVRPKKPRRLLVFDLNVGYPGHRSSRYANYAFTLMGRKTGAFETVVSRDPAVFKPESLKQFDAVVFNNTVGNLFNETDLRQSLLDFVSGGGGLIGIHGTTFAFTDWTSGARETWPEFGVMLGARGGSHRQNDEHVFIQLDDPGHPLNAPFKGKGFEYRDEFFRVHEPYSRETNRVLFSIDTKKTDVTQGKGFGPDVIRKDNDYALAWVRSYGKGRVLYCTIGHNPYVFWDPLMLRFYLGAIQFVLGDVPAPTAPARSAVDGAALDRAFNALKSYKFGSSRAALEPIDKAVAGCGDDPRARRKLEQRLAGLLQTDVTPLAKEYVCRKLAVIGSADSVGTLSSLLGDETLSHQARAALEHIPGSEAVKALRNSLPNLHGSQKIGVIASLGMRRDSASVKAIAACLKDSDPKVAGAAAQALGNIGTVETSRALLKFQIQAPDAVRPAVADACLACAERLLESGRKTEALPLYRVLDGPSQPDRVRSAARHGLSKGTEKK